jgi:hypothetical protein
MDPATLIVTALAAGAAQGVGERVTTAAMDAYQNLRAKVAARFAGNPSREMVLAEHANNPGTWQAPLTAALTNTAAATDPALVQAARELMTLLDEAGTLAGKYTVDLRGAQGVQVGDQNTQTNTFTTPAPTVS